jgi:hypothetical protein
LASIAGLPSATLPVLCSAIGQHRFRPRRFFVLVLETGNQAEDEDENDDEEDLVAALPRCASALNPASYFRVHGYAFAVAAEALRFANLT